MFRRSKVRTGVLLKRLLKKASKNASKNASGKKEELGWKLDAAKSNSKEVGSWGRGP